MTERVKGFVVTLVDDIRIDDVEVIKQAISMIRGVADVEVSISTLDDQINRSRLRMEMIDKLREVIENF